MPDIEDRVSEVEASVGEVRTSLISVAAELKSSITHKELWLSVAAIVGGIGAVVAVIAGVLVWLNDLQMSAMKAEFNASLKAAISDGVVEMKESVSLDLASIESTLSDERDQLKADFLASREEMQLEFKSFLEAALAEQNLEFDKSLQKQETSLIKTFSSFGMKAMPPVMANGAFQYQPSDGAMLKWLMVSDSVGWKKSLDAFIEGNIDDGDLEPIDPEGLYIRDNGGFKPLIKIWE
ncbi:hypothetical protein DL239_21465 [Sedimentitalea sp. CY04]|uniref:Uncharacterized protein n=1 Tax=Parasedimentitalea denitrificans TaxID=2211118 RepID=A0ABX0WFF6_9RHOB|nr:hypothetical protein [Sedimentitalea sp. CY04]NIZ63529.1 hypothetical protein [Sedimentitalea sp. CY04]